MLIISKPYVDTKQRRPVQHCNTRAPHGQQETEPSETDSSAVGFRVCTSIPRVKTWTHFLKKKEETKKQLSPTPNEKKWEDCFEKKPK